jgi:hypothetical protein
MSPEFWIGVAHGFLVVAAATFVVMLMAGAFGRS